MKKQILIWCFFTAFLYISIGVNAQSVKGKVVDATTGTPIAHASIYLNGSSKGTISNTQGEFVLYTDETKTPLIVSYVGYQSETILNYNNKLLNIKLKPRTNELKEVIIGVGGMTREKQMKIFLTQFIGSSSKDCIISNPDDINFTYRKKTQTLEADVRQPLIIHNKKLGYKITYFLSAFSHSPTETFYKGNYVFAEDTLGLKPAEIKKILKARDKAYFGSRMHYIRSLWAHDLEKNKFYADRSTLMDINNTNNANKEQLLTNVFVNTRIQRSFFPSPSACITYNSVDVSYVTWQNGTNDARITANFYSENNLMWSGKMAEQRVSDLLPFEFEPLESLSKTPKEIINVK